MSDALTLRLMTRPEVAMLLDWAADEGRNPGLHDAELFWNADPEAFLAAELGDELVGGAAVISYGDAFAFMGPSIVRPGFRGRGLGRRLWSTSMALLRGRLGRGASIGLDGALEMRDWYAERGFVFSHRSIRYESIGAERALASGVVPAADVSFERLAAYDRRCFPAPRERFLRAWLEQPDGLALAAVDDDIVRGFGVIRRCETGARIGPLFADDAGTAEALLDSLGAFAPDEPIFIDVPEVNAWAMSLARRRRMYEMSGHARMYLGPPPRIAESRVYGLSTLEFG